jgi:hypothetical protein
MKTSGLFFAPSRLCAFAWKLKPFIAARRPATDISTLNFLEPD